MFCQHLKVHQSFCTRVNLMSDVTYTIFFVFKLFFYSQKYSIQYFLSNTKSLVQLDFLRQLLSKPLWLTFFDCVTINSVSYVKEEKLTLRRCEIFMIGQLLFLGGNICKRLCAMPELNDFSEKFISPQYRLAPMFKFFAKLSLCVCKWALNHSLKPRSRVRC